MSVLSDVSKLLYSVLQTSAGILQRIHNKCSVYRSQSLWEFCYGPDGWSLQISQLVKVTVRMHSG